jgi:hypothetical protein
LERQVLFKVQIKAAGHEYVIYDNGEISGFEEGAIVVNYYPTLLSMHRAQWELNGMVSSSTFQTSGAISDRLGAAHGSPCQAEMSDIANSTARGEK